MKSFISIIIIIISLLAFAYTGILFTIDYKKVQQEFIDLLSKNAVSEVIIGNIEIDKFPLPKMIAHNIKIPGILDSDKVEVNFAFNSILMRRPEITTVEIHQSEFDLVLRAKYEGNQLSYGKVNIKTKNIVDFLKDYPDLTAILKNSAFDFETDLIFDLVSSNEYMTLTNLKLNSKIFNCEGEISLPRNPAVSNKLNLNCSKILIAREELKEVSIIGKSENNSLELDEAKGTIASGGDFNISGNLTKNDFRSIFNGKFQINLNDLNSTLNKMGMARIATKNIVKTSIESDFKITPAALELNQFRGQIGSMSLSGNNYIKIIGGTPHLLFNYNISGFDSSVEYPALTPLFKYFASLTQDTQERSYISKFTPVRDLDYLGNYRISLINPVIYGVVSDSLNLSGNIMPGKIELKSFDYIANKERLSGSITLDTISIKPTFNFNITDGVWNTGILTVSNLLYINTLMKSTDLSKLSLILNADLSSLTQEDITLQNVKFNVKNDENIITVPYFGAKIGSSELQLNGNITAGSNLNLDFAYVYNSVELGSLARFLGFSLGLDGIANFAGNISSDGSSAEELLYKLETNSKFIASNVKVQAFGIDDFIAKISPLNYDRKNLDQDIKTYTSSSSTQFSNITGDLKISAGAVSLDNVSLSSKYTTDTFGVVYNIYNQDLNFSSLWSFQIPVAANLSIPTSIGIIYQKKGGEITQNIDTANLLKSFDSRDMQSILNNHAQPTAK